MHSSGQPGGATLARRRGGDPRHPHGLPATGTPSRRRKQLDIIRVVDRSLVELDVPRLLGVFDVGRWSEHLDSSGHYSADSWAPPLMTLQPLSSVFGTRAPQHDPPMPPGPKSLFVGNSSYPDTLSWPAPPLGPCGPAGPATSWRSKAAVEAASPSSAEPGLYPDQRTPSLTNRP